MPQHVFGAFQGNVYIFLAFDKAPDILTRYDEDRFQAIQPEIEERRKSSFFRMTARSSAWTTPNYTG